MFSTPKCNVVQVGKETSHFSKAHYQSQIITMSAIYETRCPRHAAKCFTSTISAQPTLLQPAHWCLSCSLNTCFHLRAFALALLPAWSSSFRYPNGSLLHFLQISAQMSLFPTTSIKVLLPYLVHMPLPLHPHLLSV